MNLKEAQNIVKAVAETPYSEASTIVVDRLLLTAIKIVNDEVTRAQTETSRYANAYTLIYANHVTSHTHWTAKNAKLRKKLDEARDDVRLARKVFIKIEDMKNSSNISNFEEFFMLHSINQDYINFMWNSHFYEIPSEKEDKNSGDNSEVR